MLNQPKRRRNMKKLHIFPTLVDSYLYWKANENSSTQDLIDRINRVAKPRTDAMMKGVALEKIIDLLIDGEQPDIIDGTIKKQKVPMYAISLPTEDDAMPRPFMYPVKVCDQLAHHILMGSYPTDKVNGQEVLKQVFLQADIETDYGIVRLYGYIDYMHKYRLIDLKGTSRYTMFKFQNAFQHRAYMYCAYENGFDTVDFDYLVTDYRNVFVEKYHWNDFIVPALLNTLHDFLGFVEMHKEHIHNERINIC